jgi:hypothetical protein
MVLASFTLESAQVKKISRQTQTQQQQFHPSFFSSFNHGSIVSVGMKNKAFLSVFAPNIFHSVR